MYDAIHGPLKKILVEGANAALLDIDFGTDIPEKYFCMYITVTHTALSKGLCVLSRNLSICNIIQLHRWWCVHWPWYSSSEYWRCVWGIKSVHHQSWHWGLSNRTTQCKSSCLHHLKAKYTLTKNTSTMANTKVNLPCLTASTVYQPL